MILPKDFITQTRELLGEERFALLEKGLEMTPSTSIRFNPFKVSSASVSTALAPQQVPWCNEGYYLSERPNFTFDPLFHAGCYYVQEASSMFLYHVLKQVMPHQPLMALDLCAAPGGKTTLLRTLLPNESILFANEAIYNRANILVENIEKFGHPDVIVTNNYAADYKKTGLAFDLIVADVPCSGEGMFRKDEGAINQWSSQYVEKCQQLQREIVSDIWHNLKEDGILIYSTCTFNALENEENVEWIIDELGAECIDIEVDSNWNITPALSNKVKGYRFLPGISKGEGLFMCALRKTSEHHARANKTKKSKQSNINTRPFDNWLQNQSSYSFIEKNEKIMALPQLLAPVYEQVANQLRILHAGITMGTQKGKSLIPHPSLAFSTQINRQAFCNEEVSYQQAISFLRKEAITLSPETPKGIVLITYNNQPIGFVNNLGNRANNLYSNEWKIKSGYLPEVIPSVITL